MSQREATTTRLDLDPDLVRRAKIAFARRKGKPSRGLRLEEIHFRPMLDEAVEEFLPVVISGLKSAGFRKSDPKPKQRPVTEVTWEELGDQAKLVDVSRVQLVRAVLELLARAGKR